MFSASSIPIGGFRSGAMKKAFSTMKSPPACLPIGLGTRSFRGCDMPDEQPYFTIRVAQCWECPHAKHAMCSLEPFEKYGRFLENCNGLTQSCPMWAQVQQEKKDG